MNELHNDIDKLFNQAFNDFEVEPSEHVWKNIKAAIDSEKPATRLSFFEKTKNLFRKFRFILISALFVIFTAITAYLLIPFSNKQSTKPGNIAQHTKNDHAHSLASQNSHSVEKTSNPDEISYTPNPSQKTINQKQAQEEIPDFSSQSASQNKNNSSNQNANLQSKTSIKPAVISENKTQKIDNGALATSEKNIIKNSSATKQKKTKQNIPQQQISLPEQTNTNQQKPETLISNVSDDIETPQNQVSSEIPGSNKTDNNTESILSDQAADTTQSVIQNTNIFSETSSNTQIAPLPSQRMESIKILGGIQSDKEKQWNYYGGLAYQIQIKKITLDAGLQISNYKSTFLQTIEYKSNELVFGYWDVDSVIFITDSFGSAIPEYVTHAEYINDTNRYTQITTQNQRYNYLEIPIHLGYQTAIKQWHLGASGGITYGFLIQQKQNLSRLSDNKTILSDNHNSDELSKSIVKLNLNAHITYMINSNIGFTLQSHYHRYIRKPENYRNKNMIGVQLGVGYYF